MLIAALRRLVVPQQTLSALQEILQPTQPKVSQLLQLANFSSGAAANRILGACVFERLPVVAPADPEWEIEYAEWQHSITEKYYKILPKELVDPKQAYEQDSETGEANRWQPAPLETEADRSGDRRSLKRRLDQRIFMLVRPAGKAGAPYTLPHLENREGETIRQTAERVLREAVNVDEVQPYFVGNAPAGHVETDGGTMFFNRCQLIQGQPSLRRGGAYSDYVWVAKDELADYITHRPTLKLLQKML